MIGSLRDIRLFVAAYEERSFTAAARRENATQSGVSQHIRNLEDRLGVTLFSREKGQVAPTPAGDSFYKRCIDVLRAHSVATATAQSYATGLEGTIVVGLMPTMTRCVLAPVLASFTDAHPNISVRIVEGYSGPLTQQVRADSLDFAIVPATENMPGLKSSLFLRTPEVLVSGTAFAKPKTAPSLKTLSPLRLVLPSKANTRRQLIETYCNTNGIDIERIVEMDAMLGTLDFVGRSGWVTILPGIMMAMDDPAGQLRADQIIDPPFYLDLALIEPSRRALSAPAQLFLDMLRAEAERLDQRWVATAPALPISTTPGKSKRRHKVS